MAWLLALAGRERERKRVEKIKFSMLFEGVGQRKVPDGLRGLHVTSVRKG